MRRGLRAWEPHRSRRRARGDARARLDGRLRRHGLRERSGCGEHDDDARSNAGRRRGARAIDAPWRTVGILLLYTSPSRVSTRAIGIVADVDVDVWANSLVRVDVWANSLVRVGVWANSLVRVDVWANSLVRMGVWANSLVRVAHHRRPRGRRFAIARLERARASRRPRAIAARFEARTTRRVDARRDGRGAARREVDRRVRLHVASDVAVRPRARARERWGGAVAHASSSDPGRGAAGRTARR